MAWIDAFQPRPAARLQAVASPAGQAAALTLLGGSEFGNRTDLRKKREQLDSYKLWNYIAVSVICRRASMQFPMFGVARRVEPVARQQRHLSARQAEHLRQRYGGRVLQSMWDDVEPLSESHPLVDLFRTVNAEDWWGSFVYETHLFWQLCGEFFWLMIPSGLGVPAEIYCVPNHWVEPEWNRDGTLKQWVITPDGDMMRRQEVPPDWVVRGMFKHPRSKTEGYSPSMGGASWIDNAESIEESRWHTMRNQIAPSVWIMLGEKYQNPSEDLLLRVKEKFMDRAAGTRHAGEPQVIPPDIKLEHANRSAKDMDYSGSSPEMRDNVLALRGVNKVMAGITTEVNRATVEAADVIFCQNVMNPINSMLAGLMSEKVAKRFDPRILCWFDDCAPSDWEREIKETTLDWQMGAVSPDERRIDRNRDPWGTTASQQPYLPAGLTPLEDFDPAAREEAEAEADAAAERAFDELGSESEQSMLGALLDGRPARRNGHNGFAVGRIL